MVGWAPIRTSGLPSPRQHREREVGIPPRIFHSATSLPGKHHFMRSRDYHGPVSAVRHRTLLQPTLGHRAVRRITSARLARLVTFCRLRWRVEQAAALAGSWRRLAPEERSPILETRRHAGRWRGACRLGSAPFLLFVELFLVLSFDCLHGSGVLRPQLS